MKQFRWLTALVVGALVLWAYAFASTVPNPISWDAKQGLDSMDCTKTGEERDPVKGWIHWIVTQGSEVTAAKLELGGTGSGTYEIYKQAGGSIHFYTPYYAVDGLTAEMSYEGVLGSNYEFTISDYCPGDERTLEVTKTANATFDREHFWDIDKKVETDNDEFLDGTPKIWLSIDGTGNETATWTVDVTYKGYEDSNFVVSGDITIENISASKLTKSVTAIVDDLGVVDYDDIDLDCTSSEGGSFTNADLPRDIEFGEIWTCKYSEAFDDAAQGDFGTNEVSVSVAGDPTPYTATDDWAFDEPENEKNKTVNIQDVSDLFGEKDLGKVTAPNNAQFTYTKYFAWADYGLVGDCFPGPFGNTATIVETEQSASATLKVNVQCEQLDVSKTANGTFDREHFWDIAKKVETDNEEFLDGTPKIWLYIDGSGDETATWTVDVTYKGYEDSGYNVSGVITIENTGYIDAVIDEVDDVLAGETIDVDCPVELPYPLPIGETLFCTYSEDFDGKVEGFNEVTVTTDVANADRFGYEYDASAEISWGDPNETNKTVNIQDVSDLFGEKDLGKVTAPNNAQFTYDKLFEYADYELMDCSVHYEYDNTATIVETGQSASATLKVNVQCFIYESAWAYGDDAESFCDNNFSNWGWTNLIEPGYSDTWDLWAGAGQCDTSKGTLAGYVDVVYGDDGYVGVTYNLFPGFGLEETHVYAGYYKFPTARNGRTTVAPGQYTNEGPFEGPVYVIAHAVVGYPDPDFGP